MIDIEEKYLDEIRRILAEHVPDCEVRAFGSRIEGTARKFSDLDLVLVGSEKLDWRKIESLKDAFASSDLPIIIDVIDFNAISDDFRKITENNYKIIEIRNNILILLSYHQKFLFQFLSSLFLSLKLALPTCYWNFV
jgi:predicted nucleotidyltransferase